MEHDFWHQRWSNDEIGFHQLETNPYLQRFGQLLPAGGKVFVPLCGKSNDLLWLAEQGHRVVGNELSSKAVTAFFVENRLEFAEADVAGFMLFSSADIEIYCGDFFRLTPDLIKGVDCLYDRAALVALPSSMRDSYIGKLASLMPSGAIGVMVAMEYPQSEMDGPPFSVEEAEIRSRFAGCAEVELLADENILAQNPRFQERGLTHLHEKIYRLQFTG